MDAQLVRVPETDAAGLLRSQETGRALLQRARSRDDQVLDLGEAWAGIHVTLTAEPIIPRHEALKRGIAWGDDSLENVLMGGLPTPLMTSFGPARYLAPRWVQVLADTLFGVSPEAFLEGFDPSYLTQLQVPPGEWKGPEAREELRTKYAELVAFFQQAAERREGILIVFV
jgi:hypothetical protein